MRLDDLEAGQLVAMQENPEPFTVPDGWMSMTAMIVGSVPRRPTIACYIFKIIAVNLPALAICEVFPNPNGKPILVDAREHTFFIVTPEFAAALSPTGGGQ